MTALVLLDTKTLYAGRYLQAAGSLRLTHEADPPPGGSWTPGLLQQLLICPPEHLKCTGWEPSKVSSP